MTSYNRTGNRWTVNECLQLQREFELLGLTIDEIASRHNRSPRAIMFKLDAEGFADYNTLYFENTQVPSAFSSENSQMNDSDVNIAYSPSLLNEYCEDESESHSYEHLRKQMKRMNKKINALTQMVFEQNSGSKVFLS
jgi:hypothetical protein